jgi:hypothetical protein
MKKAACQPPFPPENDFLLIRITPPIFSGILDARGEGGEKKSSVKRRKEEPMGHKRHKKAKG